jgi:hypothetical protein
MNPRREDELAPEVLVVSDDGEEEAPSGEVRPRDDAPLVKLATHCHAFLRAHDVEGHEPTSETREPRSRESRTEPS